MTVAANDRLSGPYNGNGVTVAFAYDWYISANTELRVILRSSAGVDTTQTLTTHYSVSGVGVEGGGNVTFVTAPASGEKVIIEAVTPKTQTVNYVENDRFPYTAHQAAFDKTQREIQEVQRDTDRALKFPHGEAVYRLPVKPSTATVALGQTTAGEIVHLTAADLGADVLLGDGQEGALAVRLSIYNVKAYGAAGDGVTDDTTAIQAAATACRLAGGGRLYFPAGTYIISQSILIGSNTTAYGDGDVSVIKAKQSGFVGTAAGLNCYLFRNYSWSVSALTDHDIVVHDLKFDYGTVTISGGGAHCIAMRYVERVLVERVTSEDGENCTAFLACRDTWTSDSIANEPRNCGFDHWDGAAEAHVTNCTVRGLSGTTAQGIQFTGTGTANEDRDSIDILVTGCSVYDVTTSGGLSSGIIANANDAGSNVNNARIVNNNVVGCDNGIVVAGNGGGHMIIGNKIRDGIHSCILVQEEGSGGSGRVPSDVTITGNDFNDCDASVAGVALIAIGGGAGHVVAYNRGNSGTYNYWCWLASGVTQSKVLDNEIQDGVLGTVLNQGGATNRVRDDSSTMPGLGDYGKINGDGATTNNAAVTAAEASSAKNIAVPEGVYRTTAAAYGYSLAKTYTGPGQIETNDGNWLPPSWRVVSSAPDAADFDYILTSGNSDDAQKVQDWKGTWVSGAATLGQPTTGYAGQPETGTRITYYFISPDTGYNYDTDSNDGRTGAAADRVYVTHRGNGDAFSRWSSVFVDGARSSGVGGPGTPTDALALPAGVVLGGQVLAGANDVYLNNVEINATDNGYRASAGTFITNMSRTVAGGVKNEFWVGFCPQSIGSVACDSAYRPTGLWNFVLDLTNVNLGANQAAVAMKQGHRIYGDASISDPALDRFCDSTGDDWIERSSGGFWNFVYGGQSRLQVNDYWVHGSVHVNTSEYFSVDDVQVVTNRVTGFTTAAGTANKNASGINVGTITATDANIQALSAWVKALHDALATHGLIGA